MSTSRGTRIYLRTEAPTTYTGRSGPLQHHHLTFAAYNYVLIFILCGHASVEICFTYEGALSLIFWRSFSRDSTARRFGVECQWGCKKNFVFFLRFPDSDNTKLHSGTPLPFSIGSIWGEGGGEGPVSLRVDNITPAQKKNLVFFFCGLNKTGTSGSSAQHIPAVYCKLMKLHQDRYSRRLTMDSFSHPLCLFLDLSRLMQ